MKILFREKKNDNVDHGFFINSMKEIFEESVKVIDNNTGEIICVFMKGVLSSHKIDEKLVKHSKSKSNNRGNASGKIDIKYHGDNISHFIDKPDLNVGKKISMDGTSTRSSAYPVRTDGTLIKRTRCNYVSSVSVGSFNKSNIKGGTAPCRHTAWTKRNSEAMTSLFPLLKEAEEFFKKEIPDKYKYQRDFCDKIENWTINNSIFSTITLNYDFRTATHTDKGDLKGGMTCFAVKSYGEWCGSYLCFPEYDIGVDVKDNDLLLFNPHLVHCNTEMIGEGRMSMVLYTREKLIDCDAED